MSWALMPLSAWIRSRIASLQGSAPKTPTRSPGEVDIHLPGRFDQVQEVARRAADRGNAEVLHDHELALGVAAADRDHGRAQSLGAVVRPQAAGEEAVAVGVLDDVAAMEPARGEGPDHDLRPDVQIGLRVRNHDRLPGRAGRGVEPDDLFHRAGEEPERIGVAQVRLDRERQLRDVLERDDGSGSHSALVQALPEQGNVIVGAADHRLQALQLDGPQLFPWQVVRRAYGVETARGIIPCAHYDLLVTAPKARARTGAAIW